MAAVERVLVAQGWHAPRWRTTNKDYGKFYQPHIHPHTLADPPALHILRHPPRLHHVVDYINCNDRCRPHHPTSAVAPSSSSSCHNSATLAPPFVRSSDLVNHGIGLNAHIQHLTLQEERLPMLRGGPGELTRMQNRLPDENHEASTLDERPPWRPKPLKPMILFEKKAKELEKERLLDRLTPSYKRKSSGEWLQAPSPPSKRQQVNYNIHRTVHSMETFHPATRRYSYYKYYGFGGQGAKTSWGHNCPLGQKPPFSKRTVELKD